MFLSLTLADCDDVHHTGPVAFDQWAQEWAMQGNHIVGEGMNQQLIFLPFKDMVLHHAGHHKQKFVLLLDVVANIVLFPQQICQEHALLMHSTKFDALLAV